MKKSFSEWMPTQGLYALEKTVSAVFESAQHYPGGDNNDSYGELALQLEHELLNLDRLASALSRHYNAMLAKVEEASA